MGNLHEGHMDLMRASKAGCDVTVASIFVNPMQFGLNEDFDAYPRTLDSDLAKLKNESVDYLFAPTVREMYPDGVNTQIEVPSLGNILKALAAPVISPVSPRWSQSYSTSFNRISPFGRKDYQQLAVIRRMVMDLLLPIQIQGVATGRAADGLALSSRNSYLSDSERQQAPAIYGALQWAGQQIRQGNLNYGMIEREAAAQIDNAGLKTDYFESAARKI